MFTTALTGAGQAYAGLSAEDSARKEAAALIMRSKARRAEGVAGAMEERRQGRLAVSRAQAVAAANGGNLADPTFVNVAGDLGAESEYRALARLYEGETAAQSDEQVAAIAKREGRAAKVKGFFAAGSTVLSGITTMREKYGTAP